MPRIAVIGTTAWGATLGTIWAENGLHVSLWARTEEEALVLMGAQARYELAGHRWKLFSLFRHKTGSRSA